MVKFKKEELVLKMMLVEAAINGKGTSNVLTGDFLPSGVILCAFSTEALWDASHILLTKQVSLI